jgi:transcriptional regulator with XRE-family HTH domain
MKSKRDSFGTRVDPNHVGTFNKLRIRREAHGLTQEDLADILGIPVSRVREIERGVAVDKLLAEQIADELGARVSTLFVIQAGYYYVRQRRN